MAEIFMTWWKIERVRIGQFSCSHLFSYGRQDHFNWPLSPTPRTSWYEFMLTTTYTVTGTWSLRPEYYALTCIRGGLKAVLVRIDWDARECSLCEVLRTTRRSHSYLQLDGGCLYPCPDPEHMPGATPLRRSRHCQGLPAIPVVSVYLRIDADTFCLPATLRASCLVGTEAINGATS